MCTYITLITVKSMVPTITINNRLCQDLDYNIIFINMPVIEMHVGIHACSSAAADIIL